MKADQIGRYYNFREREIRECFNKIEFHCSRIKYYEEINIAASNKTKKEIDNHQKEIFYLKNKISCLKLFVDEVNRLKSIVKEQFDDKRYDLFLKNNFEDTTQVRLAQDEFCSVETIQRRIGPLNKVFTNKTVFLELCLAEEKNSGYKVRRTKK